MTRTRLRNPGKDLAVGRRFFLIAANATPPVFLALRVVERDGEDIWVEPAQLPALARVPDYTTDGSVRHGAVIKKAAGVTAGGQKRRAG